MHLKNYGKYCYEKMEKFYITVSDIFCAGKIGGVRITGTKNISKKFCKRLEIGRKLMSIKDTNGFSLEKVF